MGDRILGMAAGSFATRLVALEELCSTIPDDLSFVDAATMSSVYDTVVHSLLDLARLEKGQTVLIHSACGGVGLSAIQICHMIGAEVRHFFYPSGCSMLNGQFSSHTVP